MMNQQEGLSEITWHSTANSTYACLDELMGLKSSIVNTMEIQ
jgi:hypothetical protein